MALAYDARRATRDIDAIFKPHGIVLEEARAVATELGFPSWWLNERTSRRPHMSHLVETARHHGYSTIAGSVSRLPHPTIYWR